MCSGSHLTIFQEKAGCFAPLAARKDPGTRAPALLPPTPVYLLIPEYYISPVPAPSQNSSGTTLGMKKCIFKFSFGIFLCVLIPCNLNKPLINTDGHRWTQMASIRVYPCPSVVRGSKNLCFILEPFLSRILATRPLNPLRSSPQVPGPLQIILSADKCPPLPETLDFYKPIPWESFNHFYKIHRGTVKAF